MLETHALKCFEQSRYLRHCLIFDVGTEACLGLWSAVLCYIVMLCLQFAALLKSL